MTDTKFKIYVNAYVTRLEKGESIESIDNLYIDLSRLTQEDIKKIHNRLDELRRLK